MAQLPDVNVVGLWIGGCNEGYFMNYALGDLKVKKSIVKRLKIFISSGNADKYVDASHHKSVVSDCSGSGAKQIRAEIYNGGHTIYQPHLTEAFKWFLQDAEEDDTRRR